MPEPQIGQDARRLQHKRYNTKSVADITAPGSGTASILWQFAQTWACNARADVAAFACIFAAAMNASQLR
jgi:hypothetical protein